MMPRQRRQNRMVDAGRFRRISRANATRDRQVVKRQRHRPRLRQRHTGAKGNQQGWAKRAQLKFIPHMPGLEQGPPLEGQTGASDACDALAE